MRKRWKQVALACLVVAVSVLLILPLTTVEVKVQLLSVGVVNSDEAAQVDPRIGKAALIILAVVVFGVLAWVVRHVHLRDRRPDA